MKTVYSPDHRLHHPQNELSDGTLVPAVEIPSRAEMVLSAVSERRLGPVIGPEALDDALLARVHDAGYIAFLDGFWAQWQAEGRKGAEALPFCFPARRFSQKVPDHLDGALGHYAFDAGTPVGPGTARAARASAAVATTGAGLLLTGEPSAFALCRPPGHHAMRDMFGGYCFFNNAALAAEKLRLGGIGKVAVLDVDYHHGNGTQDIFYARADVFFASLHADPMAEYPYFLGHAHETGEGEGAGTTLNLPLPKGTQAHAWFAALETALTAIESFGAGALVVSLGLDAYEGDPISHFKLKPDDFTRLGERLGRLGLPTLYVMEGGYAVDALGTNTANVLFGHEAGRTKA